MRLGALEGSCHTTGSQSVFTQNMLHRVDSARAQQGGPASAEEEVGGSGDARHVDCPAV